MKRLIKQFTPRKESPILSNMVTREKDITSNKIYLVIVIARNHSERVLTVVFCASNSPKV